MSDPKRLRIDIPPPNPVFNLQVNATVPLTPSQFPSSPGTSHVSPTPSILSRRSRTSQLSPEEKVQRILERHNQSFCEELDIPINNEQSSQGLWQWLCASILLSARIKSNAGLKACKALFDHGMATPEAAARMTKEQCRRVLVEEAGYDRYDEKTAGFIIDNAHTLVTQHGGDLHRIREAAGRKPAQERALLKKLKGLGDGGVDIFFREAQVVWDELFPFADKKALKAARLVGLREHPSSLAELCGNDKLKYVRLIAGLVRIEISKTFHEY